MEHDTRKKEMIRRKLPQQYYALCAISAISNIRNHKEIGNAVNEAISAYKDPLADEEDKVVKAIENLKTAFDTYENKSDLVDYYKVLIADQKEYERQLSSQAKYRIGEFVGTLGATVGLCICFPEAAGVIAIIGVFLAFGRLIYNSMKEDNIAWEVKQKHDTALQELKAFDAVLPGLKNEYEKSKPSMLSKMIGFFSLGDTAAGPGVEHSSNRNEERTALKP